MHAACIAAAGGEKKGRLCLASAGMEATYRVIFLIKGNSREKKKAIDHRKP
jgi:hypothetical protein